MKTCVTVTTLKEKAGCNNTVHLDSDSILTPSAREFAREKGLVVYIEGKPLPVVGSSTGKEITCCASSEVITGGDPNLPIGLDQLKQIITKVITAQSKPICENPKVMKVEGDKVVMEPFPEAPSGQKVGMTDVITERDGNLGAGFMTFEKSELPWSLTYDEIDYVVEGEFTVKANGKLYTMKPGDVFNIPKGTSVVFGSPSYCKVFYVVYPANWLSKSR